MHENMADQELEASSWQARSIR